MRNLRWPWAVIIVVLAMPAYGQTPPPRPAAIDSIAQAELQRQQLVGLAVAVIVDGKVVHQQGYGFADREVKSPVNASVTSFRWASISKPLTAIAALQLVDVGKLDLDADIRKYVPEFPDKGVKITSRQLLGHLGGIVHYTNGTVIRTNKTYPVAHPFVDVVNALDTFKDSALVNAPGEKYSYTTHGYILLSAVVQRAGGEPFADQVRKRISVPLAMKSLRPDYHWEDIPDRAAGYSRLDGQASERRSGTRDPDVSWKLGGGGYTSTVADMAAFAVGLVNHRLVSPKSEAVMWERQKTNDGKTTSYGLGFSLPDNGRVMHTGAQERTRTAMVLEPKTKRGVVVMTNSEWGKPMVVANAILDTLDKLQP